MNRQLSSSALLIFILCGSLAAGADDQDKDGRPAMHGFVSQGFLASSDNNYPAVDTTEGTFQFNEIGFNVSQQVTPRLRVGIQILSRDLGDIGNNHLQIDWAFGDFKWKDALGVRAGIMTRPLGFYNETRDIDSLRTSIFLPTGIYSESFRDSTRSTMGVGAYGTLPLKSAGTLSYEIQIGDSNISAEEAAAKYINDVGVVTITKFNVKHVEAAQLIWRTPLSGLRLGGTYGNSESVADAIGSPMLGPLAGKPLSVWNETNNWVASVEYTWRTLILVSECTRRDSHHSTGPIKGQLRSHGSYIGASNRFADRIELGTSYSKFYGNVDDKEGKQYVAMGQPAYRAWLKDFAMSLRVDIHPRWIAKVEGHVMDGAGQVLKIYNPNGMVKDWFLFAAKLTFTF